MASSSPLPPDDSLAPTYLVPCGILAAVDLCICTARILTKLRPSPHLHGDDYLIAIATLISFSEYVLAGVAAVYGWARPSVYVAVGDQVTSGKLIFAVGIQWAFSTAFIRISVAWSLLRLRKSISIQRIWTWTLWIVILLQILIYIGWMATFFFSCRPLRGLWETVPSLVCWPAEVVIKYNRAILVILIGLDFLLAIMPVQLIWPLTRPTWEKVLISCLMAMGLFATGVAIYKATISGITLPIQIQQELWCKLEEQLGIIAACLPCLKGPVEKVLRRMGIIGKQVDPLPSFVVSGGEQPSSRVPLFRFPSSKVSSADLGDLYRAESGAIPLGSTQAAAKDAPLVATTSTSASLDTEGD